VLRSKYQLLHFRFAVAEDFLRARAHRYGRHPRRRADGFLRAAENKCRCAAGPRAAALRQRCDGIDDQQCAKLIRDFAKWIDLRQHARGSLALREPDNLDFLALAARRTSSGSTGLPYGASTLVIFAGVCDAITAMRSENTPLTQNDRFIAFFQSVSTEASIPPEPEAESGIVMRFSV